MVERRCRTTLLAQTEGVAGPLLARNEVNPRADMDLSLAAVRTDTTAPLFSLMPHTPVETSSSRPAVFITHPVLQAVLTATQEMVHRMSSVEGSGVQGAGCAPGERHVFVYNTENTLMSMFVYTGSTLTYEAHYAYDPLGRRIEKREIDHTGGKTIIEQYVYRDEDIVFRINVDPNTGKRAVNQVYTHGELAVDDPVAFSDCPNAVCSSGGWSFFGKDQVQSVEALYNPINFYSKNIIYDSYGNIKNSLENGNSISIIYMYTSRQYDSKGIIYFRNRYYADRSGRFIFIDKIIGSWSYSYSLYNYVTNNPINGNDPYGLYVVRKGTSQQRNLIDIAMRKIKEQYAKRAKKCCKKEFQDRDIDVENYATKETNFPIIYIIIEKRSPCYGKVKVIEHKGKIIPYIYINDKCFNDNNPCNLGSLLFHEFIHIARRDRTDIEDIDFQKKCRFGCIDPTRYK